MKTPALIPVALLLAAAAAAADKPVATREMRDPVDPEVLKQRFERFNKPLAEAATGPREFTEAEKAEAERKAKWQVKSLLERSEILSYNGLTTLVPKGALLSVPERYRARIGPAEGNRLVRWPEFLRHNRNWLRTFEVSREQAEGREEFSEQALESIEKNELVVIATIASGPVSILSKPAEPAEQPESGEPESQTTSTDKQS
jgi:hypothetical protein